MLTKTTRFLRFAKHSISHGLPCIATSKQNSWIYGSVSVSGRAALAIPQRGGLWKAEAGCVCEWVQSDRHRPVGVSSRCSLVRDYLKRQCQQCERHRRRLLDPEQRRRRVALPASASIVISIDDGVGVSSRPILWLCARNCQAAVLESRYFDSSSQLL
jgi:hypothetical protein